MRTFKFSSIAIAMLMTSLCLFLAPNSNIYAHSTYKTEGGPRTVILCTHSIKVIQEQPEQLQVTVIRKSDGNPVYQTSSSAAEIIINTEDWESGEYVVQTNCPENDYQEFPIEI